MATIDYRTSKIVTKPISIKAVSQLIGAGTYDLGRLCTSDKVNMWAKYKPWNSDGPGTVTPWVVMPDIDMQLRKGAFYGITWSGAYPFYKWVWNKPLGVDSTNKSPYRLQDFEKYKHDAIAPLNVVMYNTLTGEKSIGNTQTVEVQYLKGFTLETDTECQTEFRVIPQTVDTEYEYSLADLPNTYKCCLLAINTKTDGTGGFNLFTLEKNSSNVFFKNFTIPRTAGTYQASILHSMNTADENPSDQTVYPLMSKTNVFDLKMIEKTVFENASMYWSKNCEFYLAQKEQVNISSSEIWMCYKITAVRTNIKLTMDNKYARNVWLAFSFTVGYKQADADGSNITMRIIRKTDIDEVTSIETALRNGKYVIGGENFIQQTATTEYTRSSTSGIQEVTLENASGFELGDNYVWICVPESCVSHDHIEVKCSIVARRGQSSSSIDCGSISPNASKVLSCSVFSGSANNWY